MIVRKWGRDQEDNSFAEQLKSALFIVPVLGTAAALTFDVGYFSGIDINLFTLFSLSERVLFAFEALPLVLALSAVPVGVVIGIAITNDLDDFRKPPPSWLISSYATAHSVVKRFPSKYAIGFFVWIALYIWSFMWPPAGWIQSLAFILVSVAEFLLIIPKMLWRSRRPLVSGAVIVTLLSVYFTGRFIATEYLSDGTISHLVETKDGVLEGKIIRSGDKGLLFRDVKAGTVLFVKWDDIKRVIAAKAAPQK